MKFPPTLVDKVAEAIDLVPARVVIETQRQEEARAAITAAIDWMKENVSGQMSREALVAYYENRRTHTPRDTFIIMLENIGEPWSGPEPEGDDEEERARRAGVDHIPRGSRP